MNRINNAITEFGKLESLARRDQWVNHIYPLVSLGLTVLYIAITVSFGKYDLFGLAGMAVYPLALFILADLRLKECLYRLRVVLPLVLVIGLFNPLLDKTPVLLGSRVIRGGWISMITLMMKGVFSVLASLSPLKFITNAYSLHTREPPVTFYPRYVESHWYLFLSFSFQTASILLSENKKSEGQ